MVFTESKQMAHDMALDEVSTCGHAPQPQIPRPQQDCSRLLHCLLRLGQGQQSPGKAVVREVHMDCLVSLTLRGPSSELTPYKLLKPFAPTERKSKLLLHNVAHEQLTPDLRFRQGSAL